MSSKEHCMVCHAPKPREWVPVTHDFYPDRVVGWVCSAHTLHEVIHGSPAYTTLKIILKPVPLERPPERAAIP